MHRIGKTNKVTLEGKTFEVELRPHHNGETYATCERDCPKGWQILTYWLFQGMRNDPKTREKFGLESTWEYVQNPDTISQQNSYVARFYASSDSADLDCDRDPSDRGPSLGVRYAREIPKTSNK